MLKTSQVLRSSIVYQQKGVLICLCVILRHYKRWYLLDMFGQSLKN